jgi:hypothetical protein
MGVGSFASGTQVEIDTVGAMPPGPADRLFVAGITRDTAVNNALLPCTIFCNMVEGTLKGLTVRIEALTVAVVITVPGYICACNTLRTICIKKPCVIQPLCASFYSTRDSGSVW